MARTAPTQTLIRGTDITELRDQLIEVFHGLRNGTIKPKDAVEINNTAGKIISSAKVQIAYYALRGECPDIPFIGPAGKPAEVVETIALKAVSNEP